MAKCTHLKRLPFAGLLSVFVVPPTIGFVVTLAQADDPAKWCGETLITFGWFELVAMWLFVLMLYKSWTSPRDSRVWFRFGIFLVWCACFGLSITGMVVSGDNNNKCQDYYRDRYDPYVLRAPDSALAFGNAQLCLSILLLLYSIFPLSFGIAWFCLTMLLVGPLLLVWAILTRSATTPKLNARFGEVAGWLWMIAPPAPDANDGNSSAEEGQRNAPVNREGVPNPHDPWTKLTATQRQEQYPYPIRRRSALFVIVATWLPTVIPALVALVPIGEPARRDALHCDHDLYTHAWAMLGYVTVELLVLYWVHTSQRRGGAPRGVIWLAMLMMLVGISWASSQFNWSDDESTCSRGAYDRGSWDRTFTPDQTKTVEIHRGVALLLFFWSFSPLVFCFAWTFLNILVIGPGAGLFMLIVRPVGCACGETWRRAATCWWDDTFEWPEPLLANPPPLQYEPIGVAVEGGSGVIVAHPPPPTARAYPVVSPPAAAAAASSATGVDARRAAALRLLAEKRTREKNAALAMPSEPPPPPMAPTYADFSSAPPGGVAPPSYETAAAPPPPVYGVHHPVVSGAGAGPVSFCGSCGNSRAAPTDRFCRKCGSAYDV